MHLQDNIRFLVKHKGLTYQRLGEAIGATEGMIKTYALKGATPPLDILCNLADFTGLTLDVLVREPLNEESYRKYHRLDIAPGLAKALEERLTTLEKRFAEWENQGRKKEQKAQKRTSRQKMPLKYQQFES